MSECEACSSSVVVNDVDVVMAQRTPCTHREKRLTVTLILLSILSFGLLAFIIVSGPLSALISPFDRSRDDLEFLGICDTKECVDVSHRAINSGNFSANPCDDFYHFACAKWQSNNPVTNEQLYSAVNINLIRDGVELHIKKLLEVVPNSDRSREYSAPRAFYQSCLNFTNPDESVLLVALLDSLGGYRTSETWSESEFDLTLVTLQFLQLNAAPLFDLTLDIDAKNRSRYALIVELPRTTSLVPNLVRSLRNDDDQFLFMESARNNYNDNLLQKANSDLDVNTNHGNGSDSVSGSPSVPSSVDRRQFLYKMITDNLEEKRRDQLKELAYKIGRHLNVKEEEMSADGTDIAFVALSIEKLKPSQRSRKFLKQKNKVYNAYTVDTLQAQFDSINWKVLLEGLMARNRSTATANQFNWNDATIYVPYPDYLRRLFQAIQFTNKRLLFNTMLLIYVRDMLSDLMQKKKDEPRWRFCVQSTKSIFTMELSSLYLRSFESTYLHRVRNEVDDIFARVKDSLISFLNGSTWLEKLNKQEAVRKIQTLRGNFLGPSFYLREDYLDDALKNIRIDPRDFFSNVRLIYRTFREQLYRLYWNRVDEDRATWAFVTFPTTVNAFYIQQFNSIVVPLAFLNPPHYTLSAPKYINYATIALTIAHEALHALDSSGSDFDADGKLQELWIGESRGFLREKSSCVSQQYTDHFKKTISFYQTPVPIQVDGNLTQNENLADIAGLQVAFNAYLSFRRAASRDALQSELKIPGLNYSLEQIYFLSVAQSYCANISPMGYIFLLEMDEHTPHPERMNGMLMNIPEFSRAFNCPLGSNMNPEQKCALW